MITDTIPSLLALDPSDPEQAMRLRAGIGQLLGWSDVIIGSNEQIVGRPPDGHPNQYERVSPYESSLDAAVTLVPQDVLFTLQRPGIWCCTLAWKINKRYFTEMEEEAAMPALAVCRAWLRYELARRENGEEG